MGWTLLGLFVLIVIECIIASEMKNIALSKGHENANRYFWLSFWLGLPGWIMVAALPNNRELALLEKLANQAPASAAVQPAAPAETPVCKDAPAAPNPAPAGQQAPIIIADDPNQIRCPNCGLVQKSDRLVCWKCGTKFVKE